MKYLISLLFIVSLTANVNATEEPLVEAFGSLPDVKQMKISPQGDALAYLQQTQDTYALVVQNLADNSVKPVVFGVNEGQLNSLWWANNERIIFSISVPYYHEPSQMWFTMYRNAILNTKTGEAIFPFTSERYQYNTNAMHIEHLLPADKDHIMVSNFYRSNYYAPRREGLFKLNLNTGDTDLVHSAYMYEIPNSVWRGSMSWLFDESGKLRGYQEYDDNSDRLVTYLQSDTSNDLNAVKHNAEAPEDMPGIYTISDGLAYIYSQDESGIAGLYSVPADDLQSPRTKVAGVEGYDIDDRLMLDQHTSKPVGVSTTKDFYEQHYVFDEELKGVYAALQATFEGSQIQVLSYTKDRQVFTFVVSGGEFTRTYYMFDRKAQQISFLGDGYPEVKTEMLGSTRLFEFKASDGLTIPGYLTLPAASDSKPELLVIPHGGPHARDSADFDWLRNFYVANGYAVYQPNFRGSTGYGEEFTSTGIGQWGRKMQQDVNEGTQAVLASGLVSERKPCILGASYGGYTALMASVKGQDIFRCAVSINGVSNIPQLILVETLQSRQSRDFDEQEYAQRFFEGEASDADLASISPHLLADKNALPTLLFHGKLDTVVRYKQSENMVARLQANGHEDAILIPLPGADHNLSKPVTRKIVLSDSLYFIQTR